MSEYWKSTPRYWCKHCKIFVRDTKLETANHNASPRHQGNIKGFLRDLQRDHERNEREKERAKSEVSRLNSLVSGMRPKAETISASVRSNQAQTSTRSSLFESQRKQHLSQLADMGINIPSELRAEMAMPGEWQVVSERILEPKSEGDKEVDLSTPYARKKLIEEEDDPLELKADTKKRKLNTKSYYIDGENKELDALLKNVIGQHKTLDVKTETYVELKQEIEVTGDLPSLEKQSEPKAIKSESCESENILSGSLNDANPEVPEFPSVVFKKRKIKNIRQK